MHLAEIFFPELAEWQPVLARLAIPLQAAVEIAVRARSDASDFQTAMLASGAVTGQALLHALADDLGIGLVDAIDPDKLVLSAEQAVTLLRGGNGQVPVKLIENGGGIVFLITPQRLQLDSMRRRMKAQPMLARFLRMVDPQILRRALLKRAHPELARTAKNGLFERFPHLSARIVANAWQGSLVGALATVLPVGLLLARDSLLFAAHIAATFFFFACVALRFAAVAAYRAPTAKPPVGMPDGDKPVYSVLVALYREAALVPDLLASLDRLVWPRGRLDIKLVCEADDAGTLAVIRARELPVHVEVVEVPKCEPRTKPKALAYALQIAAGEFVVLYDAEDDPHPMQLVDAWQHFCASGPDLAAVQAPLEISNRHHGLVARMFAFEYAGLFRGMLPWLSRQRLMLPLGGTSNHFRRAALEEVGGWDPFNVTEDADLGMRLTRFGYRTEVISSPTREAAPRRFGIWLPQRTRWFKGWSQTWLVHMRDPFRLIHEIGVKSFLIAQVLFAGMLASALLHPLLVVTFAVLAARFLVEQQLGGLHSVLFAFDTVNIACGYVSFLLLGWQTLTRAERKDFWKIVLFTPPYWVMLSLAGWRALWHLLRRPYHWEKTPHEPNR